VRYHVLVKSRSSKLPLREGGTVILETESEETALALADDRRSMGSIAWINTFSEDAHVCWRVHTDVQREGGVSSPHDTLGPAVRHFLRAAISFARSMRHNAREWGYCTLERIDLEPTGEGRGMRKVATVITPRSWRRLDGGLR
jgi:hypothetical protein